MTGGLGRFYQRWLAAAGLSRRGKIALLMITLIVIFATAYQNINAQLPASLSARSAQRLSLLTSDASARPGRAWLAARYDEQIKYALDRPLHRWWEIISISLMAGVTVPLLVLVVAGRSRPRL